MLSFTTTSQRTRLSQTPPIRAIGINILRQAIELPGPFTMTFSRATDPQFDLIRLRDTKGNAVPSSCNWLFRTDEFILWQDDAAQPL